MSDGSRRWFEQFSDGWWDLTSARGLLAGIGSGLLNLVLFVLITGLFVVAADRSLDPGPHVTTAVFSVVVLVGGLAGLTYVYLATVGPVVRFWQTISGRLVTNTIKYGGYVGLLIVAPFLTLFAGLSFVAGRILGHLGLFLSARYARQP